MHDGQIHGGEAEELRCGLEKLLEEWSVTPSAIQRLLDRVDARDSLAQLEIAFQSAEKLSQQYPLSVLLDAARLKGKTEGKEVKIVVRTALPPCRRECIYERCAPGCEYAAEMARRATVQEVP